MLGEDVGNLEYVVPSSGTMAGVASIFCSHLTYLLGGVKTIFFC